MGDLSIVIEDESNMINLWDFSGNPAGFLEDEKGSVIRDDFVWETYQIKNLTYTDYQSPFYYSKYKAEGDLLGNWVSLGFRQEEDFAVGIEGNYHYRQDDTKDYVKEFTSPAINLIFSKFVTPQISYGANVSYIDNYWRLRNKPGRFPYLRDHQQIKDFLAEIGLKKQFISEVTLGVILGYSSLKYDEEADISDSYAVWLSGQTMAEIADKLKLGLETTLKYTRADFKSPINENGDKEKENYYYASLKFRGIYELTPKLNAGLFFSDNEPLVEFYYPVDGLFMPWSLEFNGRHFGTGCSYQFNEKLLIALEYHLRDSSRPDITTEISGYKIISLNLGVEGMLSDEFTLRGGFVRTELRLNPDYFKRRETWENTFTSGFGYQPSGGKFILEFSYRYAYKKFPKFLSDDLNSTRNIFGLSLKKIL